MSNDAASEYAPVPGKIPGTVLNLGGTEFVVAPLTLAQYVALRPQIDALGKGDPFADIEKAVTIVHASLLRNYPNITLDQVRGLLDMGTLVQAITAAAYSTALAHAPRGEA